MIYFDLKSKNKIYQLAVQTSETDKHSARIDVAYLDGIELSAEEIEAIPFIKTLIDLEAQRSNRTPQQVSGL